MSGETERAPSGWTTDTLKDYVDTRLGAQEKAVDAALKAVDKASSKSEDDIKAWRAQANEWRGAMNDRESKFSTRREVDADIKALLVRVAAVEKSLERGTGHGEGVRLTLGTMAGLIAAAASIVVIVNVMIALLTK